MGKIQFDVWKPVMTLHHLASLNGLVSAQLQAPFDERTIAYLIAPKLGDADDENCSEDSIYIPVDEYADWYCTHLSVFHRYSILVMTVGIVEMALSSMADQYLKAKNSNLQAKHFYGKGIERAKIIFSKMASVRLSFQTPAWEEIIKAKNKRDRFAHGSLWVSEHPREIDLIVKDHSKAGVLIEVLPSEVESLLRAAKDVIFNLIDEVNQNNAHP